MNEQRTKAVISGESRWGKDLAMQISKSNGKGQGLRLVNCCITTLEDFCRHVLEVGLLYPEANSLAEVSREFEWHRRLVNFLGCEDPT